jgi:hypothetical protein
MQNTSQNVVPWKCYVVLSPRVEPFSEQIWDVCSIIPKQRTLFCLQIHVYMLVSMPIARLFCSADYVNGIKSDL